MKSLKRTARIAGLLYLVLAITGAYGILYVPSQLVVEGDLVKTVTNIRQHEFFLRSGILSNLIGQTTFLFIALSLYKLFENVSQSLCRMLLTLVTASVPISFFIIFNQLYALMLLNEGFMQHVEPVQLQIMVMSFMKMYQYGNLVIGIFWGLWLIPFGILAFRSGFIPRIIGILLVAGGISYLVDACVFVLFPVLQSITSILVSVFSSVAELGALIWLLAVGARESSDRTLPKKVAV